MKKMFVVMWCLWCSTMVCNLSAQDLTRIDPYGPVYKMVNDHFYELFNYPDGASSEGSVIVMYSIYKRGRISHVKIVKGLSPEIDAEILRVFKVEMSQLPFSSMFRGNNYFQTIYISSSNERRTVFDEQEVLYQGNIENAEKMMQYIQQELVYPPRAMESKLSGKVIASFVVDAMGEVKCGVVEQVGSADLDREALRVVSTMPSCKPYMKEGKAAASYYVLPVVFRLK